MFLYSSPHSTMNSSIIRATFVLIVSLNRTEVNLDYVSISIPMPLQNAIELNLNIRAGCGTFEKSFLRLPTYKNHCVQLEASMDLR
jgi:hypothetical protein